MFSKKFKCPKCGKAWVDYSYQCECGYQFHAIGCPECMNIIAKPILKVVNRCIDKKGPDTFPGCKCLCNYKELGITGREYQELIEPIDKIRTQLGNIPLKYHTFVMGQAELSLQKNMYENFFDHNDLNMNHYRVVRFFAFLNPGSEESKKYFLKEYGETYEQLCEKTQGDEELQKLRKISQDAALERAAIQEALHPTPKCPICGSTRLTKISALTKAAKISAFGIYGAGDIGKTYKCNNCGVKF